MIELDRQELYDIIYGCTILGTGGGGDLDEGLALIDRALALNKKFHLVDIESVPADGMFVTPYFCGSVGPAEGDAGDDEGAPRFKIDSALRAFQALEEYLGQDIYGVVPTELGGANTAVAFYVAAMQGRTILDADPAGRSVPEVQHSTYYLGGLPIAPMAAATTCGDVIIVREVADDFRAEVLVRSMAVVSGSLIAVADHSARAADLTHNLIHGAITYAGKIGRAFREAKTRGDDIPAEVARAGDGRLLFKGTIIENAWESKDGFTFGEAALEGRDAYHGQTYKVYYKNENIIAWRDGEIDLTVPDLICAFDDDRFMPIMNPTWPRGARTSIIGLPAPRQWRTDKGLATFGPGHFGYDVECVPLEDRFAG